MAQTNVSLMLRQAPDESVRSHALDVAASFIVQAPAGSGKTTLLTQRILRLLAIVERPEQILALTFTRKAAAEMRHRVIALLADGESDDAKRVLARDEAMGWQLIANPNRLQIMTFDAWCAKLTSRTIGQFAYPSGVALMPERLYERAASSIWQMLEDDLPFAPSLSRIIYRLGNSSNRFINLCVLMLKTRDQWLSLIIQARHTEDLASQLQVALSNHLEYLMQRARNTFADKQWQTLMTCINFAKSYHPNAHTENNESDIAYWQWLASLIIAPSTKSLRKTVTVKQGFPAKTHFNTKEDKALASEMKEMMLSLLHELRENKAVCDAWYDVYVAPRGYSDDDSWQFLQDLLELLPILSAQCHIVFQEEGACDFITIAQEAQALLGQVDAPSDLALLLDYRLSHILVDEFQDTSLSQMRHLEMLIAGWQAGDGRTLFLVGDPMQSIYRFRQAEVGLFLRAQQQGVGDLALTPLYLTANFRSQGQMVETINRCFAINDYADATSGAVKYNPSLPFHDASVDALDLYACEDSLSEANAIVKQVKAIQHETPKASIAILVRTRNQLAYILPALQDANIAYEAVDLQPLSQCHVIRDLLSLTLALNDVCDRVAWLSSLRAPFCCLTLPELHALCHTDDDSEQVLAQCLARLADLPKAAAHRVEHFCQVMQLAIKARYRLPLVEYVETVWRALNGPLCYPSKEDHMRAQSFFKLLQTHDESGRLTDSDSFITALEKAFSHTSDTEHTSLHVMTIHRAKGLEFDTVILPALEQGRAREEAPLLAFADVLTADNMTQCLLAPLNSGAENEVYQYCRHIERKKAHYERIRLMYVAMTRARNKLIGFACLDDEDGDYKPPMSQSLLALIWHEVKDGIMSVKEEHVSHKFINDTQALARLPIELFTEQNEAYNALTEIAKGHEHIELADFSEDWQRLRGDILHRILQAISEGGEALKDDSTFWHYYERELYVLGFDVELLSEIKSTVENVLQCERGRWLLQHHRDAKAEYAITFLDEGVPRHCVIDRTFVDEKGERWIVDYKTSSPRENETEAQFIKREVALYRKQLETYAKAFDTEKINLGIYFVTIQQWYDWVYVRVSV